MLKKSAMPGLLKEIKISQPIEFRPHFSTPFSEYVGNTYGAEDLLILLGFKLLGSIDMGVSYFKTVIMNTYPGHEIRNKIILIHIMTVGEGVAVQEDIAKHRTPVNPGKKVNPCLVFPCVGSRDACIARRTDQGRAEIIGQIDT